MLVVSFGSWHGHMITQRLQRACWQDGTHGKFIVRWNGILRRIQFLIIIRCYNT
jgi:hypothetical protein